MAALRLNQGQTVCSQRLQIWSHPTVKVTQNCIPAPVDGSRLQIMPWPTFQSMTDRDLDTIYEYLSAIPCIAGPPAPSPLHNDCH